MTDPTTAGRPTTDVDWTTREIALLDDALARTERELATARREAAAAAQAARRFRSRRAIRIANRIHERARPIARALPLGRPAAAGPTRPAVPDPATPDPATFRRTFVAALDRSGGIRAGVVAGPSAGGPAAALAHGWIRELGWSAAVPSAPNAFLPDSDVAVLVDPTLDLHGAPRGSVLVAVVDDAARWSDCDWLDDVDLVVAADDVVGAALRRRRAIVPRVVRDSGDLAAALRAWAGGTRVGIAIGIPSWSVASAWGDLHFARDVQRQLERRGVATRVHLLPEWADRVAARDDVAIHVFGLSVRARLPGQHSILWVISHPERVTGELLDAADRVYVASDPAAERFAAETRTPIAPLHQATDPERFPVDRSGPPHDVLFVGNTRGVRRTAVEWLVPTELGLAIYGAGWENQPDAAPHLRGRHIPNDEVHRWYGAATVLLNDHWPDMREQGFISNRLYDGLAAGAFIVTDDVAGLGAEFDDGLVAVATGGALRWAVHEALGDADRRRTIAERGRAAVLGRHTFGHRVATILADLEADLGGRLAPSRIAAAAAPA